MSELNITTEVEYAAFNDAAYFEPLFANGTLPPAFRNQIDEPLHTGTLWSVRKFATFHTDEREREGKLAEVGPIIVRKRTITRTDWQEVDDAELRSVTL